MILKKEQNTALSAPEFPDMTSVANRYANWEGNDGTPVTEFLCRPGRRRDLFLLELRHKTVLDDNGVLHQQYLI